MPMKNINTASMTQKLYLFLVIYNWTLKVNGRNGIYQLIQQQSELLHNGAELCIYHPWGPINPCKFLKLGWHLFSSFYFEL